MKLFAFLLPLLFCVQHGHSQSVGIGTAAPSNNAILDIVSENKGLLLPRLSDTLNVENPSAGLMIYNENTQTPSFHNGTSWSTLATASGNVSGDDSITYIFNNGQEARAVTYNQVSYRDIDSLGRPASPNRAAIFTLTKKFDANTVILKEKYYNDSHRTNTITINFYKQGEPTPYYKVEYTDCYIIRAQDTYGPGPGLVEAYWFSFRKIQIGNATYENAWPIVP